MTWIFTYEDDRPLVTDRKGNAICSVFGSTVNEELDRGVLLAAAPRLLNALTELLKYSHGKITLDVQTGEQVGVAWAEARAAIKEATNES